MEGVMYNTIKMLMDEKGITSYRLAKETGITQASLSRWKKEKASPSLKALQILSAYFNVSIDHLSGR